MDKKKSENSQKIEIPKSFLRKHSKRTAVVIALIIIVLAGFLTWLYTGQVNSAKRSIFAKLPLPVAVVSGRVITSHEYFSRLELARKLLSDAKLPTSNLDKTYLDQLVMLKKTEVLAAKNDLKVSNEEVEDSYQAMLDEFPNRSEEALSQELRTRYNIDIATLKNEVLRQTLLEDKLQIWFHGQESLNTQAYKEARDLLAQIDDGANFEDIAKKYTDDEASKDFAGDQGFVPESKLFPEFREAIEDLAIDDPKLVVSREGLHIIRINAIEEQSDSSKEKSYSLQQIYIKGGDFEKWLNDQATTINAIRLLNI